MCQGHQLDGLTLQRDRRNSSDVTALSVMVTLGGDYSVTAHQSDTDLQCPETETAVTLQPRVGVSVFVPAAGCGWWN